MFNFFYKIIVNSKKSIQPSAIDIKNSKSNNDNWETLGIEIK